MAGAHSRRERAGAGDGGAQPAQARGGDFVSVAARIAGEHAFGAGTGRSAQMKRLLLLLAFVVAALPAAAADIKNLDLGKNAEVWFAEDHTVPIISLVAAMPAGSAYDPADKAGLASFAASLIDEGAGNMDA